LTDFYLYNVELAYTWESDGALALELFTVWDKKNWNDEIVHYARVKGANAMKFTYLKAENQQKKI